MQKKIPAGYRISDASCMQHDLLWRAIDDIAWQGDIAVSCPDDAILHGVIFDENNQIVGASWSDAPVDSFNFHVAVSTTHQGAGLGSLLTDLALEAYHTTTMFKQLPLHVCVVHEKMYRALKKRGMKVISNNSDSTGYFRVHMTY